MYHKIKIFYRTLTGYLDQVIDEQDYRTEKGKLILQKKSLEEEMTALSHTCFLAKKPFTPPKAGIRIRLENQAKQRGRAYGTPTPWLVLNR